MEINDEKKEKEYDGKKINKWYDWVVLVFMIIYKVIYFYTFIKI